MEIYTANIVPLMEENIYEKYMGLIPYERQESIKKFRQKADRCRGLCAGLLLEYGLSCRGLTLQENRTKKQRVTLGRASYGKPFLKGVQNLYFNLSHAGDYAAAAFSGCEVGIDIEQFGKAKMGVAHRFFAEEENAYLDEFQEESAADREFIRLWTRKESYIKAVGKGMSLPLDSFTVLEDKVSGEENFYFNTWERPEGYFLSVCTKERMNAQIIEVDLVNAFDTKNRDYNIENKSMVRLGQEVF